MKKTGGELVNVIGAGLGVWVSKSIFFGDLFKTRESRTSEGRKRTTTAARQKREKIKRRNKRNHN